MCKIHDTDCKVSKHVFKICLKGTICSKHAQTLSLSLVSDQTSQLEVAQFARSARKACWRPLSLHENPADEQKQASNCKFRLFKFQHPNSNFLGCSCKLRNTSIVLADISIWNIDFSPCVMCMFSLATGTWRSTDALRELSLSLLLIRSEGDSTTMGCLCFARSLYNTDGHLFIVTTVLLGISWKYVSLVSYGTLHDLVQIETDYWLCWGKKFEV